MADGRHFGNGYIAISQPGIIRFQLNFVLRRKFCFQGRKIKITETGHIDLHWQSIFEPW